MAVTIDVASSDSKLRIFPLWGIEYGATPEAKAECTCPLGPKCRDVGKHPMVRWRHYEGNEKGPSGGYGIPTGSTNGFFVLDLDVKEDRNGIQALLELAAGKPLPDTAAVLTPSGGVHLYWRLPPGAWVPNRRGLVPGVDVRGEGGYVVGPGSPHKNGSTYREPEEDHPLADPPDWLLELVTRKPEPAALSSEHYRIDPASPKGVQAIAWAKSYLAGAEPAIEGQDGSGRLFATCCHLMYSALPLDVLQGIIEEDSGYNSRCVPPWSAKEIEHKLVDADRRMEEPRGLASPDFWLKLAGRTQATVDIRTPDILHEYTFTPGMRSGTELSRATFGDIQGDLFDHVDWAGVLAYDTFRDRIIAVDPPMKMDAETTAGLSDNDVQNVRSWLEYHGKKVTAIDVRAAIESVARLRPFDPRQDYLKSIVWDRVPRLDLVLTTYFNTADGAYEQAIGPRWFISLVARAMRPGCQSDCTLILESSEHGWKKTSAFRALMPDPTWCAEPTCGMDSKDFLENLRGVWLQPLDELDSLGRGASLTRIKSLLTRTIDRYRPSYGHYSKDYPRTAGFCGSTNEDTYLPDSTGNRRFWPVKVLRPIDTAKIERDRDQLWAEAFARWQAGEPWHVNTPELQALCEEQQEERFEVDPWEVHALGWLHDPAKVVWEPLPPQEDTVFKGLRPYDASHGVSISAVLELAINKPKDRQTNGDQQRVGRILRRIGMQRVQKKIPGKKGKNSREWVYVWEKYPKT